MKYYLIAGEASGDLHASHLMHSLAQRDKKAEFRFFGGDMMQSVGGTLVQHYRDLAYMGFIPVLLHLRTILRGMKHCQEDILAWQPDVLILVDYPGFNLKIAAKMKALCPSLPIFYYISPKIWAWKEHRIHQIRRNIDRIYSILPFEVDFFEGKHHYPIDYVGNPTVDEVAAYKATHEVDFTAFCQRHGLSSQPVIALLPGSRQQEINDNLSRMLEAAMPYTGQGYQLVVTGAPGIEPSFYDALSTKYKAQSTKYKVQSTKHKAQSTKHKVQSAKHKVQSTEHNIHIIYGHTYDVLQHATAALVTSGTATLETALFNVPQVVCYYMHFGHFVKAVRPYFLKVPFISLVNLIARQAVVPELVACDMNAASVRHQLSTILPGGSQRHTMLEGYKLMAERLGAPGAPDHAAEKMIERLASTQQSSE